jgi:hypothetical protein
MSKKSYEPVASDFKNMHVPEIKIDPSDPASYSSRVLPEQETRRRILTHARMMGCEKEMMLLFIKADGMMRNCNNEQERQDIGKYFCVEAYRLLGGGSELLVNGERVM